MERTRASSRAGVVAALAPTIPTGRPTNAEFPTAASTPPVSIMTPEPGSAATATRAARSGFRCQRLIAHPDDGPGAGSGQEATKTQAHASAGGAGADRAGRATAARRLKRLMLSKAVADR